MTFYYSLRTLPTCSAQGMCQVSGRRGESAFEESPDTWFWFCYPDIWDEVRGPVGRTCSGLVPPGDLQGSAGGCPEGPARESHRRHVPCHAALRISPGLRRPPSSLQLGQL
ncbi:unnamed protein product [Pipistrellus nathusii]|uniref:Uncharacterized protein n=1 Tax=Pipistrellus nathusii TaxID=59473 RepID=A0ABN9ZCK9_PIPNA